MECLVNGHSRITLAFDEDKADDEAEEEMEAGETEVKRVNPAEYREELGVDEWEVLELGTWLLRDCSNALCP